MKKTKPLTEKSRPLTLAIGDMTVYDSMISA